MGLLVGIILLGILALRTWKDIATVFFPSYAIQHHLSGDSREHKIERKRSEENIVLGTQSTKEEAHDDIEGGNRSDAVKRRNHASASTHEAVTTQTKHHSATTHFLWASAVGIIGGCATMLTNSMGPILNVYLLSVAELSPQSYVGTRAMFFCFLNLGKLPMRVIGGTLGAVMLPLVAGLGLVSVFGVLLAKPIMLGMNEKTFVRLELGVVAFAGLRLCYLGIKG
ncbi:hypothetical protein HJC23_013673 [Cyclotella cryptica]|uniref:Membrane transporter protein n=1 Tax=Cyclotella cryptica TaxID=29204 RepID=A0ABD3QVD1_9STRA